MSIRFHQACEHQSKPEAYIITGDCADENYREIVRHRRLYGDSKQQSMDWLPYLKQLSIRPRALKYTGVYELMPPALQLFLEGCSNTETGKVLKVLAELTDRTGFDSALSTVNQALCYGTSDADSLHNLYRRLYADVPELPPMELSRGYLIWAKCRPT